MSHLHSSWEPHTYTRRIRKQGAEGPQRTPPQKLMLKANLVLESGNLSALCSCDAPCTPSALRPAPRCASAPGSLGQS
jgi:hypothetical protein